MSEVEIEDKPNHGSKTYWGEHGKHQKESDILQKLVPNNGQSQDTRIELYRRTANTYYDIYNNGGGDASIGLKTDNDEFSIGVDKNGQPTINGKPALNFRIEKLMPDDKKSKKTQDEEKK